MNEPIYKCTDCGNKVTYDEYKQRYDALLAQGIIMMKILCKECRTNGK